MLNALQQAIADHLTDNLDRLPGLVTVQAGGAPVPTELLPAATVDWDERLSVKFSGSHFELVGDFAVTVYAVSMEGQLEADAVVNDLICRPASPKWTGLAPILAKLTGCQDDTGQAYHLRLIGESVAGGQKKGGVYESAAVLTLRVQTWVDKDKF